MISLYHEVHVTIDPVGHDSVERERLRALAATYRFRLSDLIMLKGGRHELDEFLTTRTATGRAAEAMTREFVAALRAAGFGVRRYKIEDTRVDSAMEDVYGLLGPDVGPTVMREDKP